MLESLVRSRMQGVDLRFMRIQLSTDDSQAGMFRWTKLFRLFVFILRILSARILFRRQVLYCTPAGFPRTTVLRDAAMLCATRPFFSKTILHFHSCGVREDYSRLTKWQRWLFRRGIFNADGVIRVSSLAPDNGQDLGARKEYIVPNAIDDPFPETPSPRSAEGDAERGVLRVLMVSYLCESKGVLVLVEACGELAARGVPFLLTMVGPFESDEFEARARSRVAELNISDRVRFLGLLTGEEKFAAYAGADVFCFPTFFSYESFGMVLLEAMAAGLPVISTKHSGIPAVVDDGKTAFLVEPRDAAAVADRLVRLAENVELREQMGAAGREKFLREFTIERHLDRMRDVFLDVAGEAHVSECCLPAPHQYRRDTFVEI